MSNRERPQYLRRLAEFAAGCGPADLPPEVRERTRWIIADCVPVIAVGMQQAEMKALAERQLGNAGPGRAWVIGTGRRTNPFDAALLNGTAGTWVELDEGNLFAKGHPAIQVVPAALAVAQEEHAAGADLLLGVALGYELCSRISRAANVRLALHPHGTYGVIGAAIAVARLRGFSAPQMLELINVAATMAMASSRQTLLDGATVRNIFTGHSGYMGQMAVRLVESGFTGEIDSVSAVYGRIFSDTGTFDQDRVVDGLGSEWLIGKSYFKLHPAGRYAHSVIDALEDLLSRVPGGRLDIADIGRIDIRAYMLAAILAEKNVVSSFGARFSVPFAVASILHHGRSGLRSFDDEAVANPAIQALAQRVNLSEEPAFTARYPAEQPVEIAIVMKDGTVHAGHCVVTKGEPAKPHSREDLAGKFIELGSSVWGAGRAETLYADLMRLDEIADFGSYPQAFDL